MLQLLADDGHRIAQVGVVVGVEQAAVRSDQGQLGGGGAGVDAQIGVAGVGGDVHLRRMLAVVAGAEGVVVRLALEEGRGGVHTGDAAPAVLELAELVIKEVGLIVRGAQGRADGGEAVAVLREDGVFLVQLEGVHKALPQAHQEVQWAAQKDDLAFQLSALGQAGDGLVHHCLEDGCGHVLFPATLVQDGLDVALGEHAAPAGDGVDLLVLQGQLVQLVAGDVHQCGHLVDKGAGAAGTAAVHPLLQRAAEEDDLGVLTAQLDHRVGARNKGVHSGGGGVHLLDKVHAAGLGDAQARRAGDHHLDLLAQELILDPVQNLTGLFPDLGEVPLVGAEQQFICLVQHHDLDGGGADVNTNTKGHTISPELFVIRNWSGFPS